MAAAELRAADRTVHVPALPNSGEPVLDAWLGGVREVLATLPDTGFDVVAHSAGALLWLHHSASRPDGSAAAGPRALAGIPDNDHIDPPTFRDPPLDADAVRAAAEGTVLIGSDDDPVCPAGAATVYGVPLKIATTVVRAAGTSTRRAATARGRRCSTGADGTISRSTDERRISVLGWTRESR